MLDRSRIHEAVSNWIIQSSFGFKSLLMRSRSSRVIVSKAAFQDIE